MFVMLTSTVTVYSSYWKKEERERERESLCMKASFVYEYSLSLYVSPLVLSSQLQDS